MSSVESGGGFMSVISPHTRFDASLCECEVILPRLLGKQAQMDDGLVTAGMQSPQHEGNREARHRCHSFFCNCDVFQ